MEVVVEAVTEIVVVIVIVDVRDNAAEDVVVIVIILAVIIATPRVEALVKVHVNGIVLMTALQRVVVVVAIYVLRDVIILVKGNALPLVKAIVHMIAQKNVL